MPDRPVDLMTQYLAEHVCQRVIRATRAKGLSVRQRREPKKNNVASEQQSIYGIWDENRGIWLEVFCDPDNVPL